MSEFAEVIRQLAGIILVISGTLILVVCVGCGAYLIIDSTVRDIRNKNRKEKRTNV